MDGVTDAAFRHIVCKYSKPSLTMTEFTNVEGLARGSAKMLVAFLYSEIENTNIFLVFHYFFCKFKILNVKSDVFILLCF
mgnify:CR=1 FL=1